MDGSREIVAKWKRTKSNGGERKISWKNTKAPFKSQWPHSMPFLNRGAKGGAKEGRSFEILASVFGVWSSGPAEMAALAVRKSEPGWLNLLAASTKTAAALALQKILYYFLS